MPRSGPLAAAAGWRLALVASLYCYQGIVAGFALTALPNHVAGMGAGAAALGAYAAAIGVPWILQPLWGPVVDRFGAMRMGRRRFWILAAMAGSLTALTGLLWLGEATPATLPAIAAVFTLHSACAALMDTAADAMIIDHTPANRLGTATACTRAGFVCGLAVGAILFAWVLPWAGLARAAMLLLCLGFLAMTMPLLVREAAGDAWLSLRRGARSARPGILVLLAELARETVRPVHVALLLFCMAQDFLGAVFRLPLGVHLIRQQGWEASTLSTAQGMVGLAAGTLGAWLVGRWTDRVSPERSLGWLLGASALAHAASAALLAWGVVLAGPVALSLSGITSALTFVAFAPVVMQASRGAVAASRFALYMAALNLGDVLGSAAAGPAAALGIVPLAGIVAVGFAVLAAGSAGMVRRFQQ